MNRLESRRINLWETPIFLVMNPDHEKIKKGLVDYIYSQEAHQSSRVDSKVAAHLKANLSESKFDFFTRDNPEVAELSKFVNDAALKVITEINRGIWEKKYASCKPEIDIHESWYHVTKTHGSHGAHNHGGCSWCGIYYIDVGDRSTSSPFNKAYTYFGETVYTTKGGKNRFYRPFSNSYYDPGLDWQASNDTFCPEPVEGMLVLFPSYLMHSGEPYVGESDRVLVAMNMKVNLNEVK